MKYMTQIIPHVDDNGHILEDTVEFSIIDTEKNTIEQVVCLKEAVDIIKKNYGLKE